MPTQILPDLLVTKNIEPLARIMIGVALGNAKLVEQIEFCGDAYFNVMHAKSSLM
jgi:hypothetical protein